MQIKQGDKSEQNFISSIVNAKVYVNSKTKKLNNYGEL